MYIKICTREQGVLTSLALPKSHPKCTVYTAGKLCGKNTFIYDIDTCRELEDVFSLNRSVLRSWASPNRFYMEVWKCVPEDVVQPRWFFGGESFVKEYAHLGYYLNTYEQYLNNLKNCSTFADQAGNWPWPVCQLEKASRVRIAKGGVLLTQRLIAHDVFDPTIWRLYETLVEEFNNAKGESYVHTTGNR